MKNGRPLRFLSLVIVGWTSMRVVLLWPAVDSPISIIHALAPPAFALTAAPPIPPTIAEVTAAFVRSRGGVPKPGLSKIHGPITTPIALDALVSLGPPISSDGAQADQIANASLPPPLTPTPINSEVGRLSGSAWLIARGGDARPALGGSQLGGSQAGARLVYALGEARRLAVAARVATPLNGSGREGAIGVEWRASHALRVIAEQRFALDRHGSGGPTLGIIAGIGPRDVGGGFRVEAYGQAGVIARSGTEGYGDGAVRSYRPVARIGASTIDLGVGAWGGAQRGASRLDIGPSVGTSLAIGTRRLRVNMDWRERIAGSARPASGPALSIGTDF